MQSAWLGRGRPPSRILSCRRSSSSISPFSLECLTEQLGVSAAEEAAAIDKLAIVTSFESLALEPAAFFDFLPLGRYVDGCNELTRDDAGFVRNEWLRWEKYAQKMLSILHRFLLLWRGVLEVADDGIDMEGRVGTA